MAFLPARTLRLVAIVLFEAVVLGSLAGALHAADDQAAPSRFVDPQDGWLDVSGFLDTAYGFIPLVAPITEPAVGYGAVGALIFVDRNPPDSSGRHHRPNITAIGGLGTENGTQGFFAGHLGTWMDGRLRTELAVADVDANLDFFGLGGNRNPGGGLPYSIGARGGLAGGSYRLGDSSFWIGLRYALAKTNVTFGLPFSDVPGISPADSDLRLAALTPSLTRLAAIVTSKRRH